MSEPGAAGPIVRPTVAKLTIGAEPEVTFRPAHEGLQAKSLKLI